MRRLVGRALLAVVVFSAAISLLPLATFEPPANPPVEPPAGPPVAIQMFDARHERGIFLFYNRGHCPDAYLITVPAWTATDAGSLAAFWRWFRDAPSAVPAGVEVRFSGVPDAFEISSLIYRSEGGAWGVTFQSSSTARDFLDAKYFVKPASAAILISGGIVSTLSETPPRFFLGGGYCI